MYIELIVPAVIHSDEYSESSTIYTVNFNTYVKNSISFDSIGRLTISIEWNNNKQMYEYTAIYVSSILNLDIHFKGEFENVDANILEKDLNKILDNMSTK